MLDTSLYEELTRDFDEAFEKARHGYYKDTYENRKKKRVGMPYGNKYEIVSDDLKEANDNFNKEIDRYKEGKMGANEIFHLGKASGKLANFVPNKNIIVLKQRVLSKGLRKKHNVDIEQIRNLPILISDPIMIFKRKNEDSYSVLIRTKDNDSKNIFVAIHLNQENPSQIDKDKGILIVDEIKSFHGREFENIINPMVENNSLIWANKKDSLELLSSAQSTPQYNNQDYLRRAIEKINSIPSDRKITLKKSLEQQFDEFLIQKARISYPIGTIKQFNVGGKMKDYIKTANGWRPKNKGNKITETIDSLEKENNRQKTKENTSEQKNRIKQITQTYVKIAC